MKKRVLILFTGMAFLGNVAFSLPAAAQSKTFTINITAVVKPACQIALTQTHIENNHLVLRTTEKCNTQRDVKVDEKRFALHQGSGAGSTLPASTTGFFSYQMQRPYAGEPFFLVVQAK